MQIILDTAEDRQELTIKHDRAHAITNTLENISRRSATASFGSFDFYRLKGQGYTIWYNTYSSEKDLVLTKKYANSFLGLAIMYKHGLKFLIEGIGELYLNEKEYCFAYLPQVNSKARMINNKQYETFSIHFSMHLISELNKKFPALNELLLYAKRCEPYLLKDAIALSLEMITIVNEIINNNFVRYKKMYVELKVKELLLRAFENIHERCKQHSVKLTSADITILKKVPEILIANITEQNTIASLSKKMALNKLKLKVGFKRIFGITINQFIVKARMEKAFKLISETSVTMSEIAVQVGYKNTSSLTRAFKNFYGYTPLYLRMKKRQ